MNAQTQEQPQAATGRFSLAVFWAIAARQADRAIGIVSISILARLLTPSDFGLVAMAAAVAAMTAVLTSFGFDWALIRVKDPTREHYDTAWTLRAMSGLFTCGMLMAIGPLAADFYHRPEVTWIIALLGVNAAISATENIGMVDFRRALRFEPEFRARMTGRVCGFICAVTMAYFLRTYWALVVGTTLNSLASVTATYRISKYRPRICFSKRKEFLSFSTWMLLASAIDMMRARFAEIYIGRFFGSRSVGEYSLALELSSVAASEVAAPINRVSFSQYAREAGSLQALSSRFLQVSGLIWIVGLPAAVGIEVCAREIVATLLGSQWADSANTLRVLALVGIVSITEANTHYVYWALGRARFVTVLGAISAAVFIAITLVLGRSYGAVGVAAAQVIGGVAALMVNYLTLVRTLALRWSQIVATQWRVVAASALMGLSVLELRGLLADGWPVALRLAVLVSSGALAYAAVAYVLWVLSGRPDGSEEKLYGTLKQLLWKKRVGAAA